MKQYIPRSPIEWFAVGAVIFSVALAITLLTPIVTCEFQEKQRKKESMNKWEEYMARRKAVLSGEVRVPSSDVIAQNFCGISSFDFRSDKTVIINRSYSYKLVGNYTILDEEKITINDFDGSYSNSMTFSLEMIGETPVIYWESIVWPTFNNGKGYHNTFRPSMRLY